MNIQQIHIGLRPDGTRQYLTEVLNEMPSHVILNKLLPGLGATYLVLKMQCNSIIVEPNVPVIQGKVSQEKHKDDHLLGVFKGIDNQHTEDGKPTSCKSVSNQDIADYIMECQAADRPCKIITTPESLQRVVDAIQTTGMDACRDFFWLLDEVQKLVTDVDYRSHIIWPIDLFFKAERKAMVSATPLPMSDPRFEEQGFTDLTVVPDYDYHVPLRLITTNSVVREFVRVCLEKKDDGARFFIFFNSTDGAISYIEALGIRDRAAIFCSQNSVAKLKGNDCKFENAYSTFEEKHMKRFNFLTSRFFSAVDIELEEQPHVILLTDLFMAPWTMFDPYTDTTQIVGRFRNGIKSVTHISNIKPDMNCLTHNQVERKIYGLQTAYQTIQRLRDSEADEVVRRAFDDVLQVLPFKKYLNPDGTINYFMIDCEGADEEMKLLYTDAKVLASEYIDFTHFTTEHEERIYAYDDATRVKLLRPGISKKEMQRIIVGVLKNLLSTSIDAETERELSQYDPFIVRAFKMLGAEKIEELHYNAKKIKAEMAKLDFRNQAKSPIVIRLINNHFEVGKWYPAATIKEVLQRILKDNKVRGYRSANGTTITRYFDAQQESRRVDGVKKRGYLLKSAFFVTE